MEMTAGEDLSGFVLLNTLEYSLHIVKIALPSDGQTVDDSSMVDRNARTCSLRDHHRSQADLSPGGCA